MVLHEHEHVLGLFRSLRFWAWCGIALVPALAAAAYRTWTSFALTPILVGLTLTVGISVVIVQSLLRGRAITNRGVFLRCSEPVRFWSSIIVLAVMYCLAVVGVVKL